MTRNSILSSFGLIREAFGDSVTSIASIYTLTLKQPTEWYSGYIDSLELSKTKMSYEHRVISFVFILLFKCNINYDLK